MFNTGAVTLGKQRLVGFPVLIDCFLIVAYRGSCLLPRLRYEMVEVPEN